MIKFLSLFSGIGAFEKALTNLNIPFELINYCEIDKYASRSYSAIHNVDESKNLWDITKVDATKLPNDIDVVSFGFPCQDISSAGKMKGLFNEDGTKTRSGLFFDALRIIDQTKPKIAIAENVKALTSNKFKEQFALVLDSLEKVGYNTSWKVLNANDFGMPQNRERVFIVCIRKDIDNGNFEFPESIPLMSTVRDYATFRECDDLTMPFYNRYKIVKDENATYDDFINYINDLPIKNNAIKTKDLNMYSFNEMNVITLLDGCTGTLTCRNVINYNKKFLYDDKLYRPSPLMCFRLQGFTDTDFDKASQVVDDQYLYKQAGNSICVTVVEALYKSLIKCGYLL